MRWLALYLPALPLQAFSRPLVEHGPVAVFADDGRRSRIVARNRAAARLGVRPGLTLAEAHALARDLLALPRERSREQALLRRLALALTPLTPNVHIDADYGLLLEVGASLRLFGGAAALLAEALRRVEANAASAHAVLAPTALAARWLGRTQRSLCLETPAEAAAWLDDLAIGHADWSPALLTALRSLGLHVLREVRALPSAALRQRFGEALTMPLAQAYGEAPLMLPFWTPPDAFAEHVEFAEPVTEAGQWMPGVTTLLERLQCFLEARASVTTAIRLHWSAGRRHGTAITLEAGQPLREAQHWQRLLAARLEREPVPHEVSRIELHCTQIEVAGGHVDDLFERSGQRERQGQALGAVLRARLGEAALRAPHQPHGPLPESRAVEAEAPAPMPASMPDQAAPEPAAIDVRPTWLIEPPRRLSERELRGLLPQLPLRTPERLREDWSQPEGAPPAERDYYVARTPDARLWWVFRERAGNAWFLHGVFG